MNRKTLTGAFLAATVGAMFLTTPLFAQDSSSGLEPGQRQVRRRQQLQRSEFMQRRKPQLQRPECL